MSYLIRYVHFSQDVLGPRFSEMKRRFIGVQPNILKKKKDKNKIQKTQKKCATQKKPLQNKRTERVNSFIDFHKLSVPYP